MIRNRFVGLSIVESAAVGDGLPAAGNEQAGSVSARWS